jgi:hypothetical protein
MNTDMSHSYWIIRCLAAEECIAKSPCDPDITEEQVAAHTAWKQAKGTLVLTFEPGDTVAVKTKYGWAIGIIQEIEHPYDPEKNLCVYVASCEFDMEGQYLWEDDYEQIALLAKAEHEESTINTLTLKIFNVVSNDHPDTLTAAWLMEKHTDLSKADAEEFLLFCLRNKITVKSSYGDGEIMWPLWNKLQAGKLTLPF